MRPWSLKNCFTTWSPRILHQRQAWCYENKVAYTVNKHLLLYLENTRFSVGRTSLFSCIYPPHIKGRSMVFQISANLNEGSTGTGSSWKREAHQGVWTVSSDSRAVGSSLQWWWGLTEEALLPQRAKPCLTHTSVFLRYSPATEEKISSLWRVVVKHHHDLLMTHTSVLTSDLSLSHLSVTIQTFLSLDHSGFWNILCVFEMPPSHDPDHIFNMSVRPPKTYTAPPCV